MNAAGSEMERGSVSLFMVSALPPTRRKMPTMGHKAATKGIWTASQCQTLLKCSHTVPVLLPTNVMSFVLRLRCPPTIRLTDGSLYVAAELLAGATVK